MQKLAKCPLVRAPVGGGSHTKGAERISTVLLAWEVARFHVEPHPCRGSSALSRPSGPVSSVEVHSNALAAGGGGVREGAGLRDGGGAVQRS